MAGTEIPRSWRKGNLYLTLHCPQQADSCSKTGSADSHFVSLTVRGKVTHTYVHKPQLPHTHTHTYTHTHTHIRRHTHTRARTYRDVHTLVRTCRHVCTDVHILFLSISFVIARTNIYTNSYVHEQSFFRCLLRSGASMLCICMIRCFTHTSF